MSIYGKWKVSRILSFATEEPTLIAVEEIFALPVEQQDKDLMVMASSVIEITEDNQVKMMISIPPEAIEEAKKEGASITDDGLLIADTFTLSEENGSYICTSNVSESGPMPVSIEEDELVFLGGLLRCKKI